MRKLNFKKGDKCIVAIEKMSNVARYVDMSLGNIENWTFTGTINTVGKKYITASWGLHNNIKFDIEADYTEVYKKGGANYRLFTNIQEIKEVEETELINKKIREMLGSYGKARYTLDKLKRIEKILQEE